VLPEVPDFASLIPDYVCLPHRNETCVMRIIGSILAQSI
jgi:hypothetical protein